MGAKRRDAANELPTAALETAELRRGKPSKSGLTGTSTTEPLLNFGSRRENSPSRRLQHTASGAV